MSERTVFAIVCDVCNEPMMRFVVDNGMARCDRCQADFDEYLRRTGPELPDEPCEHEWAPTYEGSDHYACVFCGQYYR